MGFYRAYRVLRGSKLVAPGRSPFLLSASALGPASSRPESCTGAALPYLWLVGNGRLVVMVLIIVPFPPFPANQR